MPKNRKRVIMPGAKSIAILTKFKIGGRKRSQGTNQMTNGELKSALRNCRKRDRNKLLRAIEARGLTPA